MKSTKDMRTGTQFRYDPYLPIRVGDSMTVGRYGRDGFLVYLHPSRLSWAKFRELNPGLYRAHES